MDTDTTTAGQAPSQRDEYSAMYCTFAELRRVNSEIRRYENMSVQNASEEIYVLGKLEPLRQKRAELLERTHGIDPFEEPNWNDDDDALTDIEKTATPALVVAASDGPVIPKNQRPDLLTPLIEKAQLGESDPFKAAVIWPKLYGMAKSKTRPLFGVSEDGIKWTDGDDTTQFLTLKKLRDRLGRQKKAR